MSNVADELAALRAKGSVRHLSNNFSASGGATLLSTPEAAAAAMKAKREDDKLGNTKAKEILNKGSNAAAQASAARAAEFAAKRKEELEKKAQATEMLNKGGSGGVYSQEMEHTLDQTGKKKAEWERKNETKRETAGIGAMVVAPKAEAPPAEATPAVAPQASSNEYPSPAAVENNDSASTHVEEDESASLSAVAVAKQTTPIIEVSNSSIAEEEPIIADTSKNEQDSAVPVEIPDDRPKPAETENATPKLETEIEETESEDEDDEQYKDFLSFLKS